MDRELRGERVYAHDQVGSRSAEDEVAEDQARAHLDSHFADTLREEGIDPSSVPDKTRERVIEIMLREGVSDPINAYERAVMEEDHNASEAGVVEPATEKIAGWDQPDDAGAASPAGARAPAEGNAGGGGDRAGARAGGAADRGARPDWQSLARKQEQDEELTEASAEAARAPEPPAEPEKAVSMAQAAAADADKLLADLLPKLTDAEREIFETRLTDLKNDETARAQIAKDAAACLTEAAA